MDRPFFRADGVVRTLPRTEIESDVSDHDERVAPDARYDFAAIQAKWLPVWEELQPFRTDVVGDNRLRRQAR